ncbi:hypothetical protein ACKGJO_04550 [Gracilimonas sp. Q87]|uniref:hypothetical protein n=1 Tax=Gracilimonas sp. Q87 TaxID=3384766 RepID=UPI003983ED32
MKYSGIICFVIFILITGCNPASDTHIQEIPSPASENSFYPRLFTDNTGTVFMSWMEQGENSVTKLKYVTFKDDTWSEPVEIVSDSTWFVNWADYPSIIARNGKPMAAHWMDKVEGGTYAYHIKMKAYNKGWTEAFTAHTDNTPTEHGFVSMSPATDSSYMALWLDGRNTLGRAVDDYANMDKAMTLRAAHISTDGNIIEKFLIDETVCDCCQTAIVKTEAGYAAAYRNRTSNEIRDIYTTTLIDEEWSDPKAIYDDNWHIAACPVNGPAIDAYDNTVAVAWFTGANGEALVKMAISKDHGQTYGDPVVLDSEAPLGRVDLNMTKGVLWVSWLRPNEENAELMIRKYDLKGEMKGEYSIQGLSKDRSSGFPQITEYGDGLVIGVTDVSGSNPFIKTTLIK